ncbi:hypothetical protein ACI7BZ_15300 [Xanthobacter sp. AM11]|uniref:hypothetical protein n=1 Tax=Xanthobacter sp. AM11 TaxID=3380643 RepID=UPI0039BFD490
MAHLDVLQADAAGCRFVPARPDVPQATARPLAWWRAAWIVLALALMASFFPLRFSATASLRFEVGAQPAASAVRGVAQVLASREMAHDAARTLAPQDAARIAAGTFAALGLGPGGRAEADGRSLAMRAAWRLMEDLEVETEDGGRQLRLSLSAPTPALAARAADAYVAALLALDAQTRAAPRSGEEAGDALRLPPLRRGAPAEASVLPDPPRPLALGLLAMAALVLALAGRRRHGAPAANGPVDGTMLPVQLAGAHRIAWLGGGPDGGLDLDAAVARLGAEIGPADGSCHLVLVTTEDLPEASAACAIALARQLSEDAGVALVALDGAAESLCALVSDPWAPGMSELLFGVAGFGETIHRDARSRAHVIPPGRDARSGSSVVGAERLALVLEALRRTYDYVVVAAPNLGAARGAQRLAGLDPLVVCLHADTAPSTAAVESFDALAAQRFARVVMLCVATGAAQEAADAAEDGALFPPPSLAGDAQGARPPHAPAWLAGAA